MVTEVKIFTGNFGATGFKSSVHRVRGGEAFRLHEFRTIPSKLLYEEGPDVVIQRLLGQDDCPKKVDAISLDAAGPMKDGTIKVSWLNDCEVDPHVIENRTGLPVSLINDAAAPLAANLRPEEEIGIFPGTGLGFSYRILDHDNAGIIIHSSEGGHPTMSPTNWLEWEFRNYLAREREMVNPTEELALRGGSFGDYVKFLELISTGKIVIPEKENVPPMITLLKHMKDEETKGAIPQWLQATFDDESVDHNKLITEVALGEDERQSLHCEVALAMWLRRLGIYTGNQIVTIFPQSQDPGVLYSGGFMNKFKGNLGVKQAGFGDLNYNAGLIGSRENKTFRDIVESMRYIIEGEDVFHRGLVNVALARFPSLARDAGLEPNITIR